MRTWYTFPKSARQVSNDKVMYDFNLRGSVLLFQGFDSSTDYEKKQIKETLEFEGPDHIAVRGYNDRTGWWIAEEESAP